MLTTSPFTYGLSDIIRRLGKEAHPGGGETSTRWRAAHVERLIEKAAFPPPLPSPDRAVRASSRWQIAAVDHWFDGQLPPDALDASEAAAMADAAADMDARAQALRVVGGTHA